ncbi:MAG: hypothetical protein ABW167_07880 [Baekduia sp.]
MAIDRSNMWEWRCYWLDEPGWGEPRLNRDGHRITFRSLMHFGMPWPVLLRRRIAGQASWKAQTEPARWPWAGYVSCR